MPSTRMNSPVRTLLVASTAFALGTGALCAQEAAPPDEHGDVVIVVGSQIRGAEVTQGLPVSLLGRDEIDAIGQASGDDLFRSIPQLGDVSFTTTRTIGSLNDARGDTASINLRALGTGNTLVLINGRRMVNHPGTQAENLVPVVTVNTNSIPVSGLERVEVLLDGASAIYGADAVAGVVNTVLKTDFQGLTAEFTAGQEDGAPGELSAALEAGLAFNDDRTRLSLFASYFGRDPVMASDREFTANADMRSRLPAEWQADTTASGLFNNTSITSAWGIFDRFTAGNITVGGVAVANAAGQFHIQPNTLPGCLAQLGDGLCIDDTSTRDPDLRYNVNEVASVQNGIDRYNAFLSLNHELDGRLELFGEAGVYLADSVGHREAAPMLGAVPIVIPASNYYNPFGPFGSPNRLPVTNAPAAGLDLVLGSLTGTAAYRPIDAGPRRTEVENLSSRFLLGLRGGLGDWDWESAVLYSKANTEDKENRVSNTLFQQALARSSPNAYNPFNGGCVTAFASGECTPSLAATIAGISVPVSRKSETSIASWDFKISQPDFFTLWAGKVGLAAGIELRREAFSDNRDPRQDGAITFDDIINGTPPSVVNDLMGNSGSLDTTGERDVRSAYVELAVPLVSREQTIPLVQSVDIQLAGRYEAFDTFGSVTKPKVSLSWRPSDYLLFHSSWSEGFRAPNLQQQYETGLQRSNNRTDFIFCEADKRAGRIAAAQFTTTCPGRSQPVISNRQGSSALEPEASTNLTYGMVLESTMLPPELGQFTFTADWWRVEQESVVGLFGDENHILLDYVLRTRPGCSLDPVPAGCFNPAVVRNGIDAQDTLDFAGTGITAVGDIRRVDDNYLNLDKRAVQGWDFGLYYDLDDTPAGDFSFRFNAAFLDKFFQGVSPDGAIVNGAAATGQIPSVLTVTGQGNLVRRFGRPEWRYTSTLTWRKGSWGAGWFTSFVGDVYDSEIVLAATQQFWTIGEYQTHNAYVQYEFGQASANPLRVRFGVRNLFDETPPLADTNFGYLGDLHNPSGRFIYLNARKRF